jgi:hypothetical protein
VPPFPGAHFSIANYRWDTSNLADRRNYEYSPEHAQQILTAIEEEFRTLRSKFRTDGEEGAKHFKFKEEA